MIYTSENMLANQQKFYLARQDSYQSLSFISTWNGYLF